MQLRSAEWFGAAELLVPGWEARGRGRCVSLAWFVRPPALKSALELPLCIFCSQLEADADEQGKHTRLLCML